jgi:hypothetical protein
MISKLFKVQDGAEESFAASFGALILLWFGAMVMLAWCGWAVVSFIRMEWVVPNLYVGWKMYRIFAVASVALALYNVLKKGDNELRYMWDAAENKRRSRSLSVSDENKNTLDAIKSAHDAVVDLTETLKR